MAQHIDITIYEDKKSFEIFQNLKISRCEDLISKIIFIYYKYWLNNIYLNLVDDYSMFEVQCSLDIVIFSLPAYKSFIFLV